MKPTQWYDPMPYYPAPEYKLQFMISPDSISGLMWSVLDRQRVNCLNFAVSSKLEMKAFERGESKVDARPPREQGESKFDSLRKQTIYQ